MSKHTPGPWVTEESKRRNGKMIEEEIEIVHKTSQKSHRMIACIDTEYLCSVNLNEEDKANAHLIASAPELLEACKEGLEILIGEMDKIGNNYLVIEQMEQAIAKAKGGK